MSDSTKNLTPDAHFYESIEKNSSVKLNEVKYSKTVKEHFTRDLFDINSTNSVSRPVKYTDEEGNETAVFSGATTNINPFNDPEKAKIINNGLSSTEEDKAIKDYGTNAIPRISPLQPFTRMDPFYARQSALLTYNRTKLPVSDLEFRKGFRHIFITRPECYIMATEGGKPILSQQAEYDEDFSSAYSRAPHLLSLLSPSYITGSFSNDGVTNNWNFLLSNRVNGLSNAPSTKMSIDENMTKSADGFTITPAKHMTSLQGSTLSLSFTDTKNLEVNDFLHLWMAYMHKRKKGVFAPPYDGYKYQNTFKKISGSSANVGSDIFYHPYDRALEYCCSIFDIVTNESDTKILYWCKYYGAYPTEAILSGLTNQNNAAIANSPSIEATFKYHYKLENVNKSLVEFNYNAGLTNDVGKVNATAIKTAYPFLLDEDHMYIGGSSMFVGSPYIVMKVSGKEPWQNKADTVSPYLQFMSLSDNKLTQNINSGIANDSSADIGDIIGTK